MCQGAHTSLSDARLHFSDKDVRIDKEATIQLGRVCYDGLGPIGEMTIYLQGMVCDGYERFAGNEITDASSRWDATAGDWQLWDKIFKNNAPTVKVAGKTKGCSFSGSQQFAVGTSAGMATATRFPPRPTQATTGSSSCRALIFRPSTSVRSSGPRRSCGSSGSTTIRSAHSSATTTASTRTITSGS